MADSRVSIDKRDTVTQSLRLSCVLSNVVIAAVQKLSFLMLFAFIIAAIYSANKR